MIKVNEVPYSSANLSADKQQQVVRLINSTNVEVFFVVKNDSSPQFSKLNINPSEGVIKPRSFAYVKIINPDYNALPMSGPISLKLMYRRRGLSRYEPPQVKGLVRLNMNVNNEEVVHDDGENKGKTFIWLLMRLLRATFLLILITYNIILIKYELSS